jgi:hypothetical protein
VDGAVSEEQESPRGDLLPEEQVTDLARDTLVKQFEERKRLVLEYGQPVWPLPRPDFTDGD